MHLISSVHLFTESLARVKTQQASQVSQNILSFKTKDMIKTSITSIGIEYLMP